MNDTNASFVGRYITDRANELIHSPIPSDAIAVVARAHALLLYQIIFLFSGDVKLLCNPLQNIYATSTY
jgi:hypothetical protein